jgi:response regulator RpfG family c-di-GMP phosphodiesterase
MSKRVLIMDDSDLALNMTAAALVDAGFEVLKAQTLAELEAGLASPIDLLLMDVHMPEAFGDDVGMVMRTVRGIRTPIVLYSTLDAGELGERARAAEVDGFVCKRDGLEAVVAKVKEMIELGVRP